MNVNELIASIVRDEDRVPRATIDECARGGAAMIDALREVVGPEAEWEDCPCDGHWWLRLHAAFILGLMDDAAAGNLLVDLMRRLANGDDESLEDWLSGYWPALFCNKPDSVLSVVDVFAHEAHAEPWLRPNAVEVLLAAARRQGPEALDACLARVADQIAGESGNVEARSLVASSLLDFPRPAHRKLLENLAALQKGGYPVFGLQDIKVAYAGPDKPSWLQFDNPWEFYSPEKIEERQKRWEDEDRKREQKALSHDDDLYMPDAPYMRDTPKTGRNDPCPCGSGKKYKKCCLNQNVPATAQVPMR
jgi:hypothetical protein